MQGVRNCGGHFGVFACGLEPLLGMCRIVIHMDQIVQHTWMVRTAGVDLLEELGCLRLALKTLRAFLDCPQNGKAVEKLGLIVWKAGISCSHDIAVAFIPRGFRSRASVFEQSGVLDEWQHSVSDDYSMTAALHRAGRPIVFLPECLTVSYVETDFAGLMEFTNRQILITRIYSTKMWAIAGATHLLFCVTIALGMALTLGDFFAGRPSMQFLALTFLPLLLASIRGAFRVMAVQEVLPALKTQTQQQSWVHLLLGVWVPYLYAANFLTSAATRKIRWRGIRYELISAQQTNIIGR